MREFKNSLPLSGEEVLDDRARASSAGQEVQRADKQHRAEQQHDERAAGDRERAGAGRGDLLLHERAGQRHDRDDHQEAADEHRQAERGVVPGRVGA